MSKNDAQSLASRVLTWGAAALVAVTVGNMALFLGAVEFLTL